MTGNFSPAGDGETTLVVADRTTNACIDLLAGDEPAATDVLAVLGEDTPEAFLDQWRTRTAAPNDVRVLDLGQRMRSASAAPTAEPKDTVGPEDAAEPLDGNVVRGVPRPLDLSRLDRTLGRQFDDWAADGARTVLYLDSLSTLLKDAGFARAVTFVEELVGTVAEYDATAYVRFVPADRPDWVRRTIQPLFDAVFEPGTGSFEAALDSTWQARALVGEQSDHTLPLDDVFDALSQTRRRRVLRCLRRRGSTVGIRDLAEQVAAREVDADGGVPTDTLRRVYTDLAHVHLPKLEAVNVVAVDEENDVVAAGPAAGRVDPYLALAAAEEREGDGRV